MAKSLQQILSWTHITKAIWGTTPGIPRPLPDAFYKSHEKVPGNKFQYIRYTGERRVPRLVRYGSPAQMADLRDVGEVQAKCLSIFEQIRLDPTVYFYLRSADDYTQDKGLKEVARQVGQFKMKFENLRTAAPMQALRLGSLYFDSSGNFLPSSSGADANTGTFSYQFNGNNQNQLNGIIDASWKLSSTNIPLHIRKIKKQSHRLTGKEIKYAIYGEDIPSFLAVNNYTLDYLARNPNKNAEWVDAGEVPNGLFGLMWVPAYIGFFEDQSAVNQDLWDPDTVVFCPEPDDSWWDIIEGSMPVPTTINIQAEGMAAMNSMKEVYGQGGYGLVVPNPPTVEMYGFDNWFPTIKVPDAVYQAVCVF